MNEQHSITGQLYIRVLNRNGKVVEERNVYNKITNAGRGLIAELFAGKAGVKTIGFFGVGTGAAPAQDSDTGLVSEVPILTPNFRKALTKLEVPVDADGKLILPVKLKISGELTFNEPFTSPVDLKEAGLFNFNTIGTPGKVIAQPPVIKVPKTGKITPQAVELVSETKAAAAAGVGSQVPPGVMYNRVTFDKITKTPDFKLQFFWEITF